MGKVVSKGGQMKTNHDVISNCTEIMHVDSIPFTTNNTSNYQE